MKASFCSYTAYTELCFGIVKTTDSSLPLPAFIRLQLRIGSG